jgi:hypothetical protein
MLMLDVAAELSRAVEHFWKIRSIQKEKQGKSDGQKDAGNRGAVTGGKHADGFVALIGEIVKNAGVTSVDIHIIEKKKRTLPGYFRPTKEWDLVVLSGETLVAVVEVKSQVGSFSNNFNNRVEEALGNAADFWAAYAKGGFKPSSRPWLGYFFMLEEAPESTAKTKKIVIKPFKVDDELQELSYVGRYQELCKRLVRERMYDAACFFISNEKDGLQGAYKEPMEELGIKNFATALYARGVAVAEMSKQQ